MKAPCKDCVDREFGCHTVCIKYNEYKAHNDFINQCRHDNVEVDAFLREQTERRHRNPHRTKGR